jgi:hypothetical protein
MKRKEKPARKRDVRIYQKTDAVRYKIGCDLDVHPDTTRQAETHTATSVHIGTNSPTPTANRREIFFISGKKSLISLLTLPLTGECMM